MVSDIYNYLKIQVHNYKVNSNPFLLKEKIEKTLFSMWVESVIVAFVVLTSFLPAIVFTTYDTDSRTFRFSFFTAADPSTVDKMHTIIDISQLSSLCIIVFLSIMLTMRTLQSAYHLKTLARMHNQFN
jgi:hypothetical protein